MSASETVGCKDVSSEAVVLSTQARRELAAACLHADEILTCEDESIAAEHLKLLLQSLMTLRRDMP